MALFSITTRAVGEQLTAAKYNSDRNEIVAGIDPATIPGTESNVSNSNVQTDPGEATAESLAPNLTGVIERLKYVIAEMKGTALWRTSYGTRYLPVDTRTQADDNLLWTPTGTTVLTFRFRIPDGWNTSTGISLKLFRRFVVATGTAKMIWSYTRVRDATVNSSSGNGIIDITHIDGAPRLTSLDIPTSVTLAAGDMVTLSVSRLGDDAGDTNTGNIVSDGHYLEYTGIASR